MSRLHRLKMIERQSRAFFTGTIEKLNDEWVFFDDESDEATMLEDFIGQEVEIMLTDGWHKGTLAADGRIRLQKETIPLMDKATLRIRKPLLFSLEVLLDEWDDDLFKRFISHLNVFGFSIYDCIYCHNTLSFLPADKKQKGVNFILFDNGECILSVHHHFEIFRSREDHWFDYTFSTGKRMMIKKMEGS
ncbi:DUF2777 domain-containing protein [Heyndrickxia acidiproducens]|uniref:DUF2777 domain-containing protein n=1 Tax=Heyndrickxia acidiproducens TaxID=1121084 RepID=UPI000363A5D9|nr:DUF2777 domain-containing protein [Heyndrickxia acidiproducens]